MEAEEEQKQEEATPGVDIDDYKDINKEVMMSRRKKKQTEIQ